MSAFVKLPTSLRMVALATPMRVPSAMPLRQATLLPMRKTRCTRLLRLPITLCQGRRRKIRGIAVTNTATEKRFLTATPRSGRNFQRCHKVWHLESARARISFPRRCPLPSVSLSLPPHTWYRSVAPARAPADCLSWRNGSLTTGSCYPANAF